MADNDHKAENVYTIESGTSMSGTSLSKHLYSLVDFKIHLQIISLSPIFARIFRIFGLTIFNIFGLLDLAQRISLAKKSDFRLPLSLFTFSVDLSAISKQQMSLAEGQFFKCGFMNNKNLKVTCSLYVIIIALCNMRLGRKNLISLISGI